jgi:hypothetical protein
LTATGLAALSGRSRWRVLFSQRHVGGTSRYKKYKGVQEKKFIQLHLLCVSLRRTSILI